MASEVYPSFQGLGDLPGGDVESQAFAVSADGSVVAGRSHSELTDNNPEAFRWTSGTGLVALGGFAGGPEASCVNDMSADGQVLVGYGTEADRVQAAMWRADGTMVGLGTLFGRNSFANGISADGSVVVGSSETLDGNSAAFRWTQETGMRAITDLSMNTRAIAVSGDGQVIAGNSGFYAQQRFRWTEQEGMILMDNLGYPDGRTVALSHDGSVMTGSFRVDETRHVAWRWTEEAGTMLLELPEGIRGAKATDISADGSRIVGVAVGLRRRAFLWDETEGFLFLDELLESEFGIDLSDWSISQANAISADGMTIAGTGGHNVDPHGWQWETEAWVLTLPEPSTLLLVAAGSVVLVLRRRR
jgi:probable HAF family extracellular repeat protein